MYKSNREWGSLTQLWAGTSTEAASMNGKVRNGSFHRNQKLIGPLKYVIPWGKEGIPRAEVNEEKYMSELWAWLEKRVQDHKSKT
jgi:retinol dehydrogenase 12